ncbi:Na+/H+ antiporter subunit A [Aeromicrobium sp. CFBP 8757]|uniref:Na+/H+ antiporter subunit A n=1 Tax=Aeromicrobium sp. CFBP 8757 TaxID=2775288 RepID=UPI00177C80D3|nr:Na+/H+ antiporter subunit A [Aeromicrobium sp. CFBP 8757]MBD8606839.1 Na+/H+ antiporter subunit A [Aeromicrobium sp. CFBP 8757]
MTALLTLHFLAAAGAPVLVRGIGRRAFLVLALAPAISFAWLLPHVLRITDGAPPHEQRIAWIPTIGLDLNFVITPLSGVLALVVTGVGALVLVYCTWYFRPGDTEIWRFSGVLTAFAGSMLGLVLSDNVYVLYIFWELTTVLSFLLIGHNPERRANRRAAVNALLVTTFGGLAMLVGLVMLADEAGSPRLQEIVAARPSGTTVTVAVMLVLVGAISKSALAPFHFWLPGAMAAPTPVSAYLHAAAMVKAGIFLVALLAPAFADVPGWRPTLIVLGIVTMILGGLRALRQYDVKLLLAYGTVSQLGFLIAMVGAGTRSAAFAGLALVCAHGLFKSTLFLVVGIVDRSVGTRDLRELSGMRQARPVLFVVTVVATGSMAGLPPLFGFTAKESGFAAFADLGDDLGWGGWSVLALAGIVVGSILTVAYSARFVWGIFAVKPGAPICMPKDFSPAFQASPVVLAVLTVVAGLAGPWLTPRLTSYAETMPPGAHEAELTLWHGFSLALGLSVLCVVVGLALFWWRKPVAAFQHGVADRVRVPDAERAYYWIMRGVDRLSVEVTGLTQRGSLPIYLGVILVVLILVPGTALVRAWGDIAVRGSDSRIQLAAAVLMGGAAILTVRSRRRLRAVLLVGITGYGTALLFVAHGAPDLALTQILVETFLLVTFVLVLRRLPPFFSDRPFNVARWVRVGIGVATGTVVAGFALVAANARTANPISEKFAKPAVEYGGGDNIVNVTLVDIRAWDTLGELSVLVVAATGVASLIFLITDRSGRPRRAEPTEGTAPSANGRWLRSTRPATDARRSVVFEVVTRLIFHTVMIFSIYLMLVGHNLPGGGFAGGLVAGLALMIRYLAGGRAELDEAAPIDAGVVLGIGLAVAALSGLIPTLLGGGVLQSAIVDVHIPVLGTLHLVTSVFFDIGVYLVVIGLALDVLRSLGGGIDQQIEDGAEGGDPSSTPAQTHPVVEGGRA